MAQEQTPEQRKRVYLEYPADWDSLSETEKRAVAAGMADHLQKQLRRGPYKPKS